MKKVLCTLWVTVEVEDNVKIEDIIVNTPTGFWLMNDDATEYPIVDSDQVSEEDVTDEE